MRLTRREALVAGLALIPGALGAQESERWKIHEWGTFTALQNESGEPLGWINTEDEPVPPFCHRLSRSLLVPVDDLAPGFFKDAPRCHPDVILRLETPVIYFHPPKSAQLPAKVDVRVDFRGGWLTEYYPDAAVNAPGVQNRQFQYGRLRVGTQGSLEWKGLQVGKQGAFPETSDAVWLSPRNVKSAPLTAANGESEQFIFYRGVAYIQAPLLSRRSEDGKTLTIHGWLPADLVPSAPLRIPRLWLADIREDGTTAFRTLPAIKLTAGREPLLATVPATFEEKDYSMSRLGALRVEMRDALVKDGLNTDEAEALLNTWDASYFRSHGMRLFFLVPHAWTDYVLPLRTSINADVTRAMIGRLELVTPRQRACLLRISTTQSPSSAWYQDWAEKNPEAWKRFQQKRQEGNLGALREQGIRIPDDYLAYLELGRFRNALVLDELKRQPTEGLKKFVDAYDLHEARIADK
jgi:hypothetical protein